MEYLAGEYSIADIACWPGIQNIGNYDIKRTDYPAIHRWFEAIKARPAVVAAIQSPETGVPSAYVARRMSLTPAQWSNLFGENLLRATEKLGR